MKARKFICVCFLLTLLAPTLQGCAVFENIIRALGRTGVTVPASDSTPPTVTLEISGSGDTSEILVSGDPTDSGFTEIFPLNDSVAFNFRAVARDEDGGVAYVGILGEVDSSCLNGDVESTVSHYPIQREFRDPAGPGDTALKVRELTYSVNIKSVSRNCPAGYTPQVTAHFNAVAENFSRGIANTPPFTYETPRFRSSASPLVASTPAVAKATPTLMRILTNTPTLVPTDTPSYSQATLTFTKNAFCRKGPGTAYFDVTAFEQGKSVIPEGRNDSDPRWWWVLLPDKQDHCWVSDATVDKFGPVEELPVQLAPTLPDGPEGFNASAICDLKAKTRTVKLGWTPVPEAIGYRLYRDGGLLLQLAADKSAYLDTVLNNKDFNYELEAINQFGASYRVISDIPACK
jgi:hypothetical protein